MRRECIEVITVFSEVPRGANELSPVVAECHIPLDHCRQHHNWSNHPGQQHMEGHGELIVDHRVDMVLTDGEVPSVYRE